MENTVIHIENVVKRFKGTTAVNDLSQRIYEGEFVALLGPNGAGKTTLIEMIEGLQQPDEGRITLFGKNWKQNERELHALMGLSLQETKFVDKLTTEETVDLFASFYGLPKERTLEILQLVNLEMKSKTYVVNLSGGQRQRLALGLALLNNPRLILLDEPTTGLDPSARREIWRILDHLKVAKKTTMILTTHYMEEAEYLCDRILIMDKGNILAEGPLQELIANFGQGDVIDFTLDGYLGKDFSFGGLKKIEWDDEGRKGKAFVTSIAKVLPAFLLLVSERGLAIADLECRKTTLDDLFISMTGRSLHE